MEAQVSHFSPGLAFCPGRLQPQQAALLQDIQPRQHQTDPNCLHVLPARPMQTNLTAILKLWQHALLRPRTSEGDICSQGRLQPCQCLLSPAPRQPDLGVSLTSAPTITLPSPLA